MRRAALVAVATLLAGCSSGTFGDPAPTTGEPEATKSNLSAEGGAGTGSRSGGMDARDAGRSPEPGAFGASCSSGSDCESNVCFSGGKGGFCSLNCTSDAQCPPGTDGTQHCNPHGYCRY